ncbi:hypothetical protein F383_02504 [Gossypium arboreum]
MLLMP